MSPSLLLSSHRFLIRSAFSFAHLFSWISIFLYFVTRDSDVGHGFVETILLYILSQSICILVIPWAVSRVGDGIKKNLVIGSLWAMIGYGSLAMGFFIASPTTSIIIFAISQGLYRAWYAIPYRVEAQVLKKGVLTASKKRYEYVIALLPIVAGLMLIINPRLFFIIPLFASLVIFVSLSFVAGIPELYERFSWGYKETFAKLLEYTYRHTVLRSFVSGVEQAVLLVIWPLLLFSLFHFSYIALALVVSITSVLTLLISNKFVPLSYQTQKKESKTRTICIILSAYIARLNIIIPLFVIITDVYHARVIQGKSKSLYFNEYHLDNATYIDELTALKEIALAFGKIIILLMTAIIAITLSISIACTVAFVLAALASSVVVLLRK